MKIWADIKGYEGVYKISNDGEIRSVKSNRIIKTYLNKKGYERVTLCSKHKKQGFFVHRLVAFAFIPNPLDKPFINHKNGIKTDNNFSNLEWCTVDENNLHAKSTGILFENSRKMGRVKLTEKDVIEIRNSSSRICDLAKKYNVCRATIYKTKVRDKWKDVD